MDSVGGPGSVAPPPSSGGPPPLPPPPHEPPPLTLKRPVLSSRDYETALSEEDHTSELLYDYSTLNAWFVILNYFIVERNKPEILLLIYACTRTRINTSFYISCSIIIFQFRNDCYFLL